MSSPSSPTVPVNLGPGEALALHHLNEATTAFRNQGAKSPAEVDAWNAQLDAIRRQFLFRDLSPRLQQQVYLCMPRSGPVEYETVAAAYMSAGPGSPFGVVVCDKLTSCTPGSFNQGWCDAWNHRTEEGQQSFQWFCLLHADIFPTCDGNWLETMIAEAEAGDYAVLHAVAAIKDHRGITSTAVGLRDQAHQWAKVRRITTQELQELPPTFDWADYLKHVGPVGWKPILDEEGMPHPTGPDGEVDLEWLISQTGMLNNTGCMLVRLTPEMKRFPGFRFQNRVVALRPDGGIKGVADDLHLDGTEPLLPQFVPEDWDLGRWTQRQRLKVGATRKVTVHHVGRSFYTTAKGWGDWPTDLYFYTPEAK